MLDRDEIKKIRTQLEVCESETDRLNDWEQNFIEDISDQFTNFQTLSPRQQEVLQRIYDKVA